MNDPIPNLPAKWANFLLNEIIRCPPSATVDTDFVISDAYESTHVVRSLPQDDTILSRADKLQYHRNMIRKYELLLTDYLSQARSVDNEYRPAWNRRATKCLIVCFQHCYQVLTLTTDCAIRIPTLVKARIAKELYDRENTFQELLQIQRDFFKLTPILLTLFHHLQLCAPSVGAILQGMGITVSTSHITVPSEWELPPRQTFEQQLCESLPECSSYSTFKHRYSNFYAYLKRWHITRWNLLNAMHKFSATFPSRPLARKDGIGIDAPIPVQFWNTLPREITDLHLTPETVPDTTPTPKPRPSKSKITTPQSRPSKTRIFSWFLFLCICFFIPLPSTASWAPLPHWLYHNVDYLHQHLLHEISVNHGECGELRTTLSLLRSAYEEDLARGDDSPPQKFMWFQRLLQVLPAQPEDNPALASIHFLRHPPSTYNPLPIEQAHVEYEVSDRPLRLTNETFDPNIPVYYSGMSLFPSFEPSSLPPVVVTSSSDTIPPLVKKELENQASWLHQKSHPLSDDVRQTLATTLLKQPHVRQRLYRRVDLSHLFTITMDVKLGVEVCVIADDNEVHQVDTTRSYGYVKNITRHWNVTSRLSYRMMYCKNRYCGPRVWWNVNPEKTKYNRPICQMPELRWCLLYMTIPLELQPVETRELRSRYSTEPVDWDHPRWNTVLTPEEKQALQKEEEEYRKKGHRYHRFFPGKLFKYLRDRKEALSDWKDEGQTEPEPTTASDIVDPRYPPSKRTKRSYLTHTIPREPDNISADDLKRTVLAYDCSQPQQVEAVQVDLKESACNNPKPIKKDYKNETMLLLQYTNLERLTVKSCEMYVSKIPFGCGMHSHMWLYVPYMTIQKAETVTKSNCQRYHRTRQYNAANGQILELELNRENTINIPIHGDIDVNDSPGYCSPTMGYLSERVRLKSVLHHYVKIIIREEAALLAASTGQITLLRDKVVLSCNAKEGTCLKEGHRHFWDPPKPSGRCPYYLARRTHGVLTSSPDGFRTFMSTDDSMVRVILKGQIYTSSEECDSGVLEKTNYDDLYLSRDVDNPWFKRKISEESLSIVMYMNHQDSYLLGMLEDRINEEHRYLVLQDCRKRNTVNSIDYAQIMAEQTIPVRGSLASLGGGHFVGHSGDVFYKMLCQPLVVKIRYTESCFTNLPVQLSSTDEKNYRLSRGDVGASDSTLGPLELFIVPRSHLLTRVGVAVPCREDLSPIYQGAYGQFIRYTPQAATVVAAPKKLQVDAADIQPFESLWRKTDFS